MVAAERETDFVQSLARGLAVVRAFGGDHPALTLSEVASSAGLARAAARRLLLTLVELGYVRVEGRLFRLTPRVLELGRAYLESAELPEAAQRRLGELAERVGESVSAAVLDGTDVVYVAHVPAPRIMAITITVGTRDPAFATSLGRAALAADDGAWLETGELRAITPRTIVDAAALRGELERVRRRGYAIVDQELEDDLRAAAVPVRDAAGRVAGAVNVAVQAARWPLEAIRRELVPPLLETASAIERDLAARAAVPRRAPDLGAGCPVDVDGDFVQSLGRGLAVILAFGSERPALTLSEVARTTGLARAAARRFLLTLVELGYVRVDGRLFGLGPRVLELGRPYLASLTLPELAQPHLRALVAELGESSTLATLDGSDIVYVAHVPARRILSVGVEIGTRDPAPATALGRALLAGRDPEARERLELHRYTERTICDTSALRGELERVRRQGWALVDQELEDGLRAVAAPIRDRSGRVVAAVNLAVYASRWPLDAIADRLLPRLLETAAAIERDVRASGV